MNRYLAYIKRHRRYAILVAALLVFGIGGLVFAFSNGKTEETPEPTPDSRSVEVASVATLTQEGTPLVLTGEVRSNSEAELRAESGGQVTGVYVKAGQYVGAGTILAETENAAQRATVMQAQGSVQAARAALAKIQSGARTEDRAIASAQEQSSQTSYEQAQISAGSAFDQSFGLAEDAVLNKADTFFDRPLTVRPNFKVNAASYDEALRLEQERVAIGEMLNTWRTETASTQNTDSALERTQSRLNRIKNFLNSIASYINQQAPNDATTRTDIAADQTVIQGARASVDAALAAVTGARQGLTQAQSAAVAGSKQLEKVNEGERPEDIQAAQASVTSAQGVLAGAVAQLENTRVRTPIAGTVSNISIRRGDFVTPAQTVAVVANKGGLEIETFISEEMKNRVTVGNEALIDGTYKGIVTSVEPGLDPVTKKSRVHIGFSGTTELTHGQFVEVAIVSGKVKETKPSDGFYIPITAIKVLPDALVVFTVSASSTLEAHEIEEGAIVGDSMLIKQGLTSDMKIVLDTRGRNEGDLVEITE